jgi:surface antigen
MAEHINNQTPLSSGGHQWLWGEPPVMDKALSTAGTKGAVSFALGQGPRMGAIVGELRGTGQSLADAQTALNALETAIEALAASGAKVAWEDNLGHSGTALVILGYRRQGPRGLSAPGKACWQQYVIEVRDNRVDF